MRLKKEICNWTFEEKKFFKLLNSPFKIQHFLDSITYSTDERYRCPRSVIRDNKAHCFDGAVFAAAALRQLGYEPLIMQLRAVRDDDHMIALYKINNHWGAIAKSNFTGLRFREPIYRNLREIALSYFESYFNIDYEKTLREYSVTLNLRNFNDDAWMFKDGAMVLIADKLDRLRHFKLINNDMIKSLSLVDQRSYIAGMYGADEKGLYKP